MKSTITLILLVLPSLTFANGEFLEMMVQGNYILVGKALESDKTYHGKVEITSNNNELIVKRIIDGVVVSGKAAIEPAAGGDAKVLRIRFKQNDESFEQTCMVGSDLDNHARISCYLYKPGTPTIQPGMEVLFNDHTAK